MLAGKLTHPWRRWSLVALAVGLAVAVALSMIFLAADAQAKKNKKKGNVRKTLTSTVAQNDVIQSASNPVRFTQNDFTLRGAARFKSLKRIEVTLTAAANDPNEDLFVALDGVDTGIRVRGLSSSEFRTVTLEGKPENQAQLLAALKDGRVRGQIIDRTPNNSTTVFVPGGPNTTLEVTGQVNNNNNKHNKKHKKKRGR